MSKITAKNLSYDGTLPPFLARLHANQASPNGRHGCQDSRLKQVRSKEDEAENEPVYYDEKTAHTLSKKEWEAKKIEEANDETIDVKDDAKINIEGDIPPIACKDKDRFSVLGSGRKRRVGKLVCPAENVDEIPDQSQLQSLTNKRMSTAADKNATSRESIKGNKKRKIKLSFDE